jgi:hypothetical protein
MSGGARVSAAARLSRIKLKRLALLPLLLAVAAPPAVAQQDGVFVDPDSPAGKEYAVPIDQARGDAAGGGDAGPGEEPLFGEGIEPPSGDSGNVQGSEGTQDSGGPGEKEEGSREKGADSRPGEGSGSSVDVGQSSAAIEAAAADGSNGLLSAGIAAAVLIAGLIGGLGLRRLLRSG